MSDTEDGLDVTEMGFIFCGEYPLLMTTRIHVSDRGSKDPFVSYCIIFRLSLRSRRRSKVPHVFNLNVPRQEKPYLPGL